MLAWVFALLWVLAASSNYCCIVLLHTNEQDYRNSTTSTSSLSDQTVRVTVRPMILSRDFLTHSACCSCKKSPNNLTMIGIFLLFLHYSSVFGKHYIVNQKRKLHLRAQKRKFGISFTIFSHSLWRRVVNGRSGTVLMQFGQLRIRDFVER